MICSRTPFMNSAGPSSCLVKGCLLACPAVVVRKYPAAKILGPIALPALKDSRQANYSYLRTKLSISLNLHLHQ